MTDREDHQLVDLSLKGDRRAFATLVDRYEKPVYNLAFRMTSNAADAEDITQAAFLKAYENLQSYDSGYRFFSWLYRIAVNEALNTVGRKKRQEALNTEQVSEEKGPEELCDDNTTSRMVQEALLELDPEQRTLLILHHLQGIPYREIGQILGIAEQTVKSRMYSSRQSLRNILMKRGVRNA